MKISACAIRRIGLYYFIGILCLPSLVVADDWPQWRSINRDGKSSETGLLQSWPEAGPPLLWKIEGCGTGYSAMSISNGRLFTMGNHGDDEYVLAFLEQDGKPLWRVRNGKAYRSSSGNGPRSTPTVDGDLVYSLGATGNLSCLSADDGRQVWQVNILQVFDGNNLGWGLSESVLIEGDMVICTPGGPDKSIVAIDKKTGRTIWTSKGINHPASYASAMALTVDNVRQIVHVTGHAAVGLQATDGKLLWQYSRASSTANCATPLVHDNNVFVTSGYGTGCALLELAGHDGMPQSQEVYFNKVMKNHHGGVVLVNGYVYGYSNRFVSMNFLTGQRAWRDPGPGKCSLIYADGHLYALSQDGIMALVEATPQQYVEKSRFVFNKYQQFKLGGVEEQDEKPTFTPPVIANGRLFLRDQDTIYCYDITDPIDH